MTTSYHAEHVGSLLRSPEVLQARSDYAEGKISLERLREIEDQAALANLALQRDAGIEVFTDGEVRRDSWMASLVEEIGNVVPLDLATGEGWHRDKGADPDAEETRYQLVAAAGPVNRKLALTEVEAAFMAKNAPGQFKITMMSASMGGALWHEAVSKDAYPTRKHLIKDLARLQAEEIESLVDAGVTWIQLDSLGYMEVIDEALTGKLWHLHGNDLEDSVQQLASVDNSLVRAAKRRNADVTVGLHFCRGNNRSAWMASGSYERVAEGLFGGVEVDRFLLEFDTERAGGFEPLRFIPKGKTVVLGLVSSKLPELESQDELCRRIDEAAKYVALEDLAITPQCGFASTLRGNLLTVDQQRRKLELVAQTARRVWG